MSSVPWLDPASLAFPAPDQALDDPDGLLAVGGDLSPERLLSAYRQGIFPWYQDPQPILWWSPDPRAVFEPGKIHCSRRLKRTLRSEPWKILCDTDFSAVIAACAAPAPGREGTWITPDMVAAYSELHRLGHAHSIECYCEGQLAGGVYGVAIGSAFFGESMFSRRSNGSKVALLALSRQLAQWGFQLIDCQVDNPHLRRMGATTVPRAEFLRRLATAVDAEVAAPEDWHAGWRVNTGQQAAGEITQ